MPLITAADWQSVLPAFLVAATSLVVLLVEFLGLSRRRPVGSAIALAGTAAAGIIAAQGYGPAVVTFGGAWIGGGFTVVFEEIVIVATLFSLMLLAYTERKEQFSGSCALMLLSATGAMLMTGAGNLMMIFLGLELLSLGLYCLCGLASRPTAREAAVKYLILSSMASGFLLYGMALLFGATGSVALSAIAQPGNTSPLYVLGVGLFLVGIGFKLSLVPFHVWAPDVYEGAPVATTAFMSVVTKVGTLAVLARFTYAALPPDKSALLVPLWIIAGLSMLIGNLAALAQTDMKRLLAYSGVAQIGYIVAALAGSTAQGLRYAIFYLVAYTFMNLGAFAVVALLGDDTQEATHLNAFAGLAARRPLLAAAMTFFLLALAGLPPTAGFLGKMLILSANTNVAANLGMTYLWLSGLLLLGTAISLYVYFKIVRAMYAPLRTPAAVPAAPRSGVLPWIAIGLCFAGVIVMGFYPKTPSDILPSVGIAVRASSLSVPLR